jgi:hypothetical protein
MQIRGQGALGVWHGIAGPYQREGEEWYNREHHAERVAIPGFLRARRYVNCGAGLRYFSRYDAADVGVLASQPYLDALNNPSPWSQKIFPHYQFTVRGAFSVVARFGVGEGGYLTSLRFSDEQAPPEATLVRLAETLSAAHGILGAEVWRVDADVTTHRTREKELRAARELFPAFAVLIDSSAPQHGAEALRAIDVALMRGCDCDVYQLVFQKFASE